MALRTVVAKLWCTRNNKEEIYDRHYLRFTRMGRGGRSSLVEEIKGSSVWAAGAICSRSLCRGGDEGRCCCCCCSHGQVVNHTSARRGPTAAATAPLFSAARSVGGRSGPQMEGSCERMAAAYLLCKRAPGLILGGAEGGDLAVGEAARRGDSDEEAARVPSHCAAAAAAEWTCRRR